MSLLKLAEFVSGSFLPARITDAVMAGMKCVVKYLKILWSVIRSIAVLVMDELEDKTQCLL